jgi:hypothetical protein
MYCTARRPTASSFLVPTTTSKRPVTASARASEQQLGGEQREGKGHGGGHATLPGGRRRERDVGRRERRPEQAIGRSELGRLPGQQHHRVIGHQRLERPGRDTARPARRVDRVMNDQCPLHRGGS